MFSHKIVLSIALLLSSNLIQAIELNNVDTIIKEASMATEVLQTEFSELMKEENFDSTNIETIEKEKNLTIVGGAIAEEIIDITETNLTASINKLLVNSIDKNNTKELEEEDEGSVEKGLVIFKTRLKVPCGMGGEEFAKNYTQEDWEDIYDSKEFKKVVIEICPKMKERYQERWTPHLFQFSLQYASDSDNIPEC